MNKRMRRMEIVARTIGEATKVNAEQVADVFRELASKRVSVSEDPMIYRDAEGAMCVGHKVEYQDEEYFVIPYMTDDEMVFRIFKLDKRDGKRQYYTHIKKVHYKFSDIRDLTETKEDFVKFVKYNFYNWLV